MKVTTAPVTSKPDVVITMTHEEAIRLSHALDTNFKWYAAKTLSGEVERWAGDLYDAIANVVNR